jgi:hypothetical protein
MNLKIFIVGVITIVLLFFPIVKSVAQVKFIPRLDHSISISNDDFGINSIAAQETLHVLAVMVDFVEDNDGRTTGTGKFDLSATDSIIDSPPHNKEYFQNHLTFLENYWSKVTNGKMIVKGEVLDSVFHLTQKMQYYSSPRSSNTFAEIGNLVQDTWQLVDSLNPGIQFSQYNSFCIFHAGAGRDIDLVSVYGYDPTPFDIPSIYLGLKNLQTIFGSGYQGVSVDSGNFFIKNSMVLPETENRKLQAIGGTALLQLSINGLLAGCFGSYLGLPDLFDTKTGKSGVGRFGLMDGQAMFSWSGLFPPEPSAWEKYFLEKKLNLGMLKIIDVPPGETIANIPAVGLTDLDTIYRVPVSAREYFLVENRNRDAMRNGSTVTMQYNGQTIQKYFPRDTSKYNAFDQGSVFGVVTDIDEFDWSLPGGVTKEGIFYDGGILVWHIDENTIEANLASNSVNADPNRRGVDLEEADGSQDIGQSYGFLNAGSGSEDGTSLDFWFDGNIAPVYKNEFGYNTHPNSMSYDMANSHITIKDFTGRTPRMSVKIVLGDDVVKLLPRYPKFIGSKAANQAPQVIDGRIFISSGDSIFVFLPDGRSGTSDSTGLFSKRGGNFPLAKLEQTILDSASYFGVQDSIVYRYDVLGSDLDGVYAPVSGVPAITLSGIASTPVVVNPLLQDPFSSLYVGDILGFVNRCIFSPPSWQLYHNRISYNAINSISVFLKLSTPNFIGTSFICVAGDSLYNPYKSYKLPYYSSNWEVVTSGGTTNYALYFAAIDKNGATLILLDSSFSLVKQINSFDGKHTGIAVSDLDNDGSRDVVVTAGRKIYAFNHNGFMLDNFPITTPDTLTNSPIIADVDGDGILDILASTKNNLVVAYSAKGKSVYGFPISIGAGSLASMSISSAQAGKDGILTAMSSDGYLYAWGLPNVKAIPWGNYRGNAQHTAFENSRLTGQPMSEFFPASRAYNWPNPVYDGKTNIRFYVSENSTVEIKIFDMAGDLVDELRTNALAGIDNEIEWNASKIQSGVYYAHIKADGATQSANAIIKIAIVK